MRKNQNEKYEHVLDKLIRNVSVYRSLMSYLTVKMYKLTFHCVIRAIVTLKQSHIVFHSISKVYHMILFQFHFQLRKNLHTSIWNKQVYTILLVVAVNLHISQ